MVGIVLKQLRLPSALTLFLIFNPAYASEVSTFCSQFDGQAQAQCNTYCEVMLCNLAEDGNESTNPHASEVACDKIESSYLATAKEQDPGASDEYLKLCGQASTAVCPCWPDGIPGLINDIGEATYCIISTQPMSTTSPFSGSGVGSHPPPNGPNDFFQLQDNFGKVCAFNSSSVRLSDAEYETCIREMLIYCGILSQ